VSAGAQIACAANLKLNPMSVKYYTHFIAQTEGAVEYNEYRGVVELLDRSSRVEGDRDIARMLARSFDLEETDIQVLQWDHLH
jgi:hypothetical protein